MSDEVIREELHYDVIIVGAGPAGLAAAIKLKQLKPQLNIAIFEKSSEISAHIISGAIFEANCLDNLLDNWRDDPNIPVKLKVKSEDYYYLQASKTYKISKILLPRNLGNNDNYIISLGALCKYLGQIAENIGIEIFPAFAANKLLFNGNSTQIIGIELGDFGLNKKGEKTANFMPGAKIFAKYSIIAEGARGSLAKKIIKHFALDKNSAPAKFALGIKEIWRIEAKLHQEGHIEHYLGYPYDKTKEGGAFLYHLEDNKIALGLITQLDYKNPTNSPYRLFQKFKQHPKIRPLLQNAEILCYGARSISNGGYYSLPQLNFPGGAIIGCAAGMVNSAKLKGIHNAINSGIFIAENLAQAFKSELCHDEINKLTQNWQKSSFAKDLYPARHFKYLWYNYNLILANADLYWQNFNKTESVRLKQNILNQPADYKLLEKSAQTFPEQIAKEQHQAIAESLSYANIIHDADQPCHLKIKDSVLQYNSELKIYAGPSNFYCPAAVYQWQGDIYQINAQNCLHCKCCDIKDPNQNIQWSCPMGGSGPNYIDM